MPTAYDVDKVAEFQSTLPRRERQRGSSLQRVLTRFQSTLPRRERRSSAWHCVGVLNFNPRSREGSDPHFLQCHTTCHKFQSTLPRRERPSQCHLRQYSVNFNPRSREGSDIFAAEGYDMSIKFQSTLPRRERRKSRVLEDENSKISIHAPAKGATNPPYLLDHRFNYFNPRSREGSDNIISIFIVYFVYFNPRSREGSDSNIIQQISFSLYNTVYFVSNNIK